MIRRRTAQAMEVEQLTALPPSEISCQLTRPAYIFAKHLMYHQRGFPVWSPNPDTYVPGPGDGGYLSDAGRFIRLFNVTLPRDAPEHRDMNSELPGNYQPFCPNGVTNRARFISIDPQQGDKIFVDKKRRESAASVEVSGSIASLVGGGLSLSNIREEGAALLTRDSVAYDMKKPYDALLRDYLLANLDVWKEFLRETMRDSVPLQSLVFITGCYNTRSWEVATFEARQSRVQVGFQVEGGASASISSERRHELAPDMKCGPEILNGMRPPRQVFPWGEEAALVDRDQTVFIKGWRFKERSRWPLKIKANAGPHSLPEADEDDNDQVRQAVCMENFPPMNKSHTLYDQLFDHYLAESDADIVMIHDDEVAIVCKILEYGLSEAKDYQYFQHFMQPVGRIIDGKKVIIWNSSCEESRLSSDLRTDVITNEPQDSMRANSTSVETSFAANFPKREFIPETLKSRTSFSPVPGGVARGQNGPGVVGGFDSNVNHLSQPERYLGHSFASVFSESDDSSSLRTPRSQIPSPRGGLWGNSGSAFGPIVGSSKLSHAERHNTPDSEIGGISGLDQNGPTGSTSYPPPNPTFQHPQSPDIHTPFQTNPSPARHGGALSSAHIPYPVNPSSSDSYFYGHAGAGEQARKYGQYSPGQVYGNTNSSGNYQHQTPPYFRTSPGMLTWDMIAANTPRGVSNSPPRMHDTSILSEGFGLTNSNTIPGNHSSFGIASNSNPGFGQTQPAGQSFHPTLGFGYGSNTSNIRTDTFSPNNLGLDIGQINSFGSQAYSEGYAGTGHGDTLTRNTLRGGTNGVPLPFGPTSPQHPLPPLSNTQQSQFGVSTPTAWPAQSPDNPRSTKRLNTLPGPQGLSSSRSGWPNNSSTANPSNTQYDHNAGDVTTFPGVSSASTALRAQLSGFPGVPRPSPLPLSIGKQPDGGATVQRKGSWSKLMEDDSMDEDLAESATDKRKQLMDNQARSREKKKETLKFLQQAIEQTLGTDEQTNNRKLPEAELIMLAAKKLISRKKSEEQLKKELTEICVENQLVQPGEQLSRRDLTHKIERALASPNLYQYNALPPPGNQHKLRKFS